MASNTLSPKEICDLTLQEMRKQLLRQNRYRCYFFFVCGLSEHFLAYQTLSKIEKILRMLASVPCFITADAVCRGRSDTYWSLTVFFIMFCIYAGSQHTLSRLQELHCSLCKAGTAIDVPRPRNLKGILRFALATFNTSALESYFAKNREKECESTLPLSACNASALFWYKLLCCRRRLGEVEIVIEVIANGVTKSIQEIKNWHRGKKRIHWAILELSLHPL